MKNPIQHYPVISLLSTRERYQQLRYATTNDSYIELRADDVTLWASYKLYFYMTLGLIFYDEVSLNFPKL